MVLRAQDLVPWGRSTMSHVNAMAFGTHLALISDLVKATRQYIVNDDDESQDYSSVDVVNGEDILKDV